MMMKRALILTLLIILVVFETGCNQKQRQQSPTNISGILQDVQMFGEDHVYEGVLLKFEDGRVIRLRTIYNYPLNFTLHFNNTVVGYDPDTLYISSVKTSETK